MRNFIRKTASVAFSALLALCILSVNNTKINAISGCAFGKVSDLHIENNYLVWTNAQSEVSDHIVQINSNEPVSVAGSSYNLFGNGTAVTSPGTYTVRVWEGSKEGDCAENYAEISATAAQYILSDDMLPQGTSASLANGGLAFDMVHINYTTTETLVPVIRNSDYEKVDPNQDYSTTSLLAVDASRFTDGKVYVNFVPKQITITTAINLGEKHKKLAELLYTELVKDEYEVSLDGSVLSIKLSVPTTEKITSLKKSIYMIVSMFVYMTIEPKSTVVDENEMLLWVSDSSNVTDMQKVVDEFFTDTSEIDSLNVNLYPVWLKYTADGSKTWYVGSGSDLLFTITRNIADKGFKNETYNAFDIKETFYSFIEKVTVEKKGAGIEALLGPDDYEVNVGSLKLTLKNDYLKTLDKSEYILRVYFNTGLINNDFKDNELYAEATFKVTDPAPAPEPDPDPTPAHRLPRTGIE